MILVYRLVDGHIYLSTSGRMSLPFCRQHNTPAGHEAIEVPDDPGFDRQKNYIDLTDPDNPTPAKRPASPVTLNGLTLENLPVPAQVTIDGVEYTTDAAEVELDFPLPGTYQIRVSAFPYLDWTGEVAV